MLRMGRHNVIPAGIMDVRVRAPASAAVPWYLSGGVAAANCLAAYTPKGAASLAASYDNNAAPGNGLADGTYDAALGIAPTFAAATGWTFNGITQYLKTGITFADGRTMSVLVRFSGAPAGVTGYMFGYYPGNGLGFLLVPSRNGPKRIYYNGSNPLALAPVASGVMAIAGGTAYYNGTSDGAITTTANTGAPFMGADTGDGINPRTLFAGNIQAVSIYNVVLSGPQVATLTTAMAAL